MNERNISEALIRLEEAVKNQGVSLEKQMHKLTSVHRQLQYMDKEFIEFKTRQKSMSSIIKWGSGILALIIASVFCSFLLPLGEDVSFFWDNNAEFIGSYYGND